MTKITIRQKKVLDGEELFSYYWIDMGNARSVKKMCSWLFTRGIYNEATGRPFTPMAIWFAMWDWAAYNPSESYEIFQKAMYDSGQFYTMEDWLERLNDTMTTTYKKSPRKLQRWQNQHLKNKTTSESINSSVVAV